jgi:hypothetical protein
MCISLVKWWIKSINSPANCNEYHELELPRAWEPLDSSRALLLGEGKEAHFSFFF